MLPSQSLTQQSLTQRLSGLHANGAISDDEEQYWSHAAINWGRDLLAVTARLQLTIEELFAKRKYVRCRAKKHDFRDEKWFLDHWVTQNDWVEVNTCTSCGTDCYRYRMAKFNGRIIGHPWYDRPKDYSFNKKAKGLTSREWETVHSYMGLALLIEKLEKQPIKVSRLRRGGLRLVAATG